MSTFVVPDVVRQLIAESIDSVPELEAILLLREHLDADWTVTEVAHRLYVEDRLAAQVLEKLKDRGFFVARDQGYRYAPARPDLEAAVSELASTYAHRVVAVTDLIHKKPSAGIRDFAEAFRFRKDK